MLSFQDFFTACSGLWTTERTYHFALKGEVERSYTEFRVEPLSSEAKQQILSPSATTASPFGQANVDPKILLDRIEELPGFSIAFDTRSEKGEQVSMSLRALFVPDPYLPADIDIAVPPPPPAAQIADAAEGEVIQGFYLRDEGYSEAGSIAGRFTYQSTRQTLEMTTYYRRSVAVDQMRFIAPNLRLRTIVTYQRPLTEEGAAPVAPTVIDLVGFGVEQKQ